MKKYDMIAILSVYLFPVFIVRMRARDEKGKILLEMPATVRVIGAILVPWMAALGAIAALATRCTIVVERRED